MISFTVPIRTYNSVNFDRGNSRRAGIIKTVRAKKQREITRLAFLAATNGERWKLDPPYRVLLRRIGPRLMDTDAYPQSMKHVRDQIAEELGVTDGPTDLRATWHYEQTRGKRGHFSVEVTIT